MRRIFAIVLIVLGLGTIGAAIASATIWRPDDRVTLVLPSSPDVPLVITAPGVLNAVDNTVDVRVVAADADAPVLIAMGKESDIRAWVDDAPHWEITGLVDWETLGYTTSDGAATPEPTETPSEPTETPSEPTETPSEPTETPSEPTETPSETASSDEEAEEEPLPDPSGSDLWIDEVTGTGEATYDWAAVPGRWMMLVASDGTLPAPQVELTWDREVETPFVQPGIILGSVVALLGLVLLTMQLLVDIERRRARRAATHAAPEPAALVTADGERPLTRREIRLAEAERRGRSHRGASSARTEDTAAGEVPSTDELQPVEVATTPDDAGELDAWVRSGSASPLLHEGERTTPDLALAEDTAAEEVVVEQATQTRRRDRSSRAQPRSGGRWWRRRRDTHEVEAEPEGTVSPAGAGDGLSGDTEQIPVIRPDEPNPQTSGASWRETWGLGPADESAGEDDR